MVIYAGSPRPPQSAQPYRNRCAGVPVTDNRLIPPTDIAMNTQRIPLQRITMLRSAGRLLSRALALAICSGGLLLESAAQTTSNASEVPDEAVASEEDTVVLSPFVVDSGEDTGYHATNTLAGTRLDAVQVEAAVIAPGRIRLRERCADGLARAQQAAFGPRRCGFYGAACNCSAKNDSCASVSCCGIS